MKKWMMGAKAGCNVGEADDRHLSLKGFPEGCNFSSETCLVSHKSKRFNFTGFPGNFPARVVILPEGPA